MQIKISRRREQQVAGGAKKKNTVAIAMNAVIRWFLLLFFRDVPLSCFRSIKFTTEFYRITQFSLYVQNIDLFFFLRRVLLFNFVRKRSKANLNFNGGWRNKKTHTYFPHTFYNLHNYSSNYGNCLKANYWLRYP